MRRGAPVLVSSFLALGAACGGGASTEVPSSTAAGQPRMAPTPFRAEQIRAACPVGRSSVWALTTPDGTARQRVVFAAHTADGAVIESVALGPDGEPAGAAERGTATWEELRLHASYPAAHTTITDATVEVPAGTFATRLYTVVDPEAGTTTRAWFAPALPGPPVRHVVEQGGQIVSSMVLERIHLP
ncbi:MAG: hypothetical protein ACFCGT_15695 [Sandaracinaceae bacterium]